MGRPCTKWHANPRDYPACGFCQEVIESGIDLPSIQFPVGGSARKSIDVAKWDKPRCRHRGSEVLEIQQCKTCTRTVDVEVFPCSIHGKCTLKVLSKDPGTKVCGNCPDHAAAVDLGKIVVINLDRRPDRLAEFGERATVAGLPTWERFAAIDGTDIPFPNEWKGGGGAWGCRLSHLRVIELAIADKTPVLTVLEDDCGFVPNFWARLQDFWPKMPPHWHAVMLGGQEGRNPKPEIITEGVKRTMNAQRTHAYVLRGTETMKTVYRIWSEAKTHIDHSNFLWQQAGTVYQPDPLLCFQAASRSDITGRDMPDRTWDASH